MSKRSRPDFPKIFAAAVALGGLLVLGSMALSPGTARAPSAPATPESTSRSAPVPTGRGAEAAPVDARPSASPPVAESRTGIYLEDGIPLVLRRLVTTWAGTQQLEVVASPAQAALAVTTQARANAQLLAERVYVPVAWFPSLRTGLTMAALRELWQGKSGSALFVSDDTASALVDLLGKPDGNVQRVPAEAITARLWSDPHATGIVPFDELNVKLSALPLDGMNVLERDAKLSAYPLVARVWLGGDPARAQGLSDALRATFPSTNRDAARLTTLVMTGVTALTRGSAVKIEQQHDPAYPARKIAPVLTRADIVHVSNEVSFVDGCVADPGPTLSFCSKPSYLATLQLIGVKIVGLTGNHLLDYGARNFIKTLDQYGQAGLRTYGGGRNAAEAARPLLLSDHGNRLAFVGANPAGPPSDWATATQPGSQPYEEGALGAQIAEARKVSDLVFVELQADETYTTEPNFGNQRLFRRTLANGADVVTGVQAHQPQAIEFSPERNDKLILYGLGNLFFDQMFSEEVRQGIVVRHTIYAGRLLQTELLTTMLEDSVQPRWMTAAERERLLRAVFKASGFKVP